MFYSGVFLSGQNKSAPYLFMKETLPFSHNLLNISNI